jgi:hypothetical protein
MYAHIRNVHKESVRDLPARTIDGIEAVGFAVSHRHHVLDKVVETNTDIWVDPQTDLPVRMEHMHGQDDMTVLHDIRFDEEIDESSLRFEPPAGSSVKEFGPAQPPTARVKEAVDRIRSGKREAPDSRDDPPRLDDVLALWESGKKDDAVKQLRSIRWDEPAVCAHTPLMNLSESEFISLPHEDRVLVQKEAIEFVGTARGLQRHAFLLAEQAQRSGDRQTAKEYYESVRKLGDALLSPDRLIVLQSLGKALVKMAEAKLAGFD